MKFETKESSPCVIGLTIRADAEEVRGLYKSAFNMFLKNGVVPGFRKGKVPAAVIQQKFAKEIVDECQQACFREFYPKALEESKLDALNLQNVTDVLFTPETGFSCTALVEVRPTFSLPKYRKLAIKKETAAVTDEDVDRSVESFRAAFAKFVDASADSAVATGDYVQIDYKGTLDDKARTPLSDLVPDQKVVCENAGFWTQVEEGRFVPEILEALKGMKVGETKDDIKVKFPKDAAPEPLKGKKCLYSVTLKSFRVRELPDDAAFVESAKAESMDALRAQTRERLEKQAADAALESSKNQAIELLLKKADFEVPPSQIQRQTQSFLQDLAQRAQYSGMPADYFEKNRDQIIADAHNSAIRQIRLSYILLGIAKEENLTATDDDVKAGLEKMAAASNGRSTVEDLRKQLEESRQVELYKEQIRAEKALDLVLAEAK
ncbi:MAG: trigger factor [Kiritimatiellia bacterium]